MIVTILRGAPTPSQALRLYHELFAGPGSYELLAKAQPAREASVPFEELTSLVRDAFPLSTAEQVAVTVARNRAGLFLRPIFDATGQVWAVENEVGPLRDLTERAVRARTHPLRAAAHALDDEADGTGSARADDERRSVRPSNWCGNPSDRRLGCRLPSGGEL